MSFLSQIMCETCPLRPHGNGSPRPPLRLSAASLTPILRVGWRHIVQCAEATWYNFRPLVQGKERSLVYRCKKRRHTVSAQNRISFGAKGARAPSPYKKKTPHKNRQLSEIVNLRQKRLMQYISTFKPVYKEPVYKESSLVRITFQVLPNFSNVLFLW